LASNSSLKILDVRTPIEFESVRAQTAHNVPLDQLDAEQYIANHGLNDAGGSPLYVICQMGGRGLQACEKFIDAGFSNVVNVAGGTKAWAAAGLPVIESGRKVLPLDCQVRIAAGSLVVIGTLLSFLNPLWALLATFVGAGLIYSGATNTCGILPMVALLPWNRVKKAGKAADCGSGG